MPILISDLTKLKLLRAVPDTIVTKSTPLPTAVPRAIKQRKGTPRRAVTTLNASTPQPKPTQRRRQPKPLIAGQEELDRIKQLLQLERFRRLPLMPGQDRLIVYLETETTSGRKKAHLAVDGEIYKADLKSQRISMEDLILRFEITARVMSQIVVLRYHSNNKPEGFLQTEALKAAIKKLLT